jgi:hypothetical protein
MFTELKKHLLKIEILLAVVWLSLCFSTVAAQENLSAAISIRSEGRGNPYINFTDGKTLSGETNNLTANAANAPTALASADFDADGMPDLATAYRTANGGFISIRRGNVESIFPVNQDIPPAPFFSETLVFDLPFTPDFLAAGDFNADGKADLLAAKRGISSFVLLAGNGAVNFSAPQSIDLKGAVTAFAVGEMNNFDNLPDVAVGVLDKGVAKILIFQSRGGAFSGEPEIVKVKNAVSALAFGALDDKAPLDLAAAAGDEIVLVSGQLKTGAGEKAFEIKDNRLARRKIDFRVSALAVGDFTGGSENEIAVLTESGELKISSGGFIGEFATVAMPCEAANNTPFLLAAKVSTRAKTDLIVGGASGLNLVSNDGAGNLAFAASFNASDAPAAVLPVRLNKDALNDLVVITESELEPAVLMTAPVSVITVNSTSPMHTAGSINFEQAIHAANNNPGLDEIRFNVPNPNSPIMVESDLPEISEAATFDATTQAGYNGEPLIEISPAQDVDFTAATLRFTNAGNSVLRGFVVKSVGANLHIIELDGGNNFIESNFIGTNRAGTASGGGAFHGIAVYSDGNTIGGGSAQARNVISGVGSDESSQGVSISGDDNRVEGNFIGTDKTGTSAIPNGGNGVYLGGSDGNVIGGMSEGKRNVISGNGVYGVEINPSPGGFSDAVIENNFIGTNKDGDGAIGNGAGGVGLIYSAGGNTPTKTVNILDNVISGNTSDGIYAYNGEIPPFFTASPQNSSALLWVGTRSGSGNLAASPEVFPAGNRIGTNASGTAVVPNGGNGILLTNAPALIEGNLISGNGLSGIRANPPINTSLPFEISENFIGTDASGSVDLGNSGDGITLEYNGTAHIDAKTSDILSNVISGNNGDGIRIFGNVIFAKSKDNVMPRTGSFLPSVGRQTQSSSKSKLSNKYNILPQTGFFFPSISRQTTNLKQKMATGNLPLGNRIGTNAAGTLALGNAGHGVSITNIPSKIGGETFDDGNIIAHNGGNGVNIASIGDQTVRPGSQVLNNLIYSNTGLGIDLGGDGVSANDLGDADTGPNNLQNYPVLTSASSNGSQTIVSGTINTTPDTEIEINFYSSPACSPSNQAEGATPLGSIKVTTNALGNKETLAIIPSAVAVGHFITATATTTDANEGNENNTSEFSQCRQVFAPTSANAAIAGRVFTPQGAGVSKAFVSLTAPNGETRSALTGSLGYYRFEEIAVGETYVISVSSKRYTFAPRAVTLNEDMTLDFTAEP